MKLYRHLELQADQRTALSQRWHSWCRRRRNLDPHFARATARLMSVCALSTEAVAHASALVETVAAAAALSPSPHDCATYCTDADHLPSPETSEEQCDAYGTVLPKHVGSSPTLRARLAKSQFIQCHESRDWGPEESDSDEETTLNLSCLATGSLMVVDPRNQTSTAVAKQGHASPQPQQSPAACGRPLSSRYQQQAECTQHESYFGPPAADAPRGEVQWPPRAHVNTSQNFLCPCTACENGAVYDRQVFGRISHTGDGAEQVGDGGLLGASGGGMHAAQCALQAIGDVHKSDDMMQFEYLLPMYELTEVRLTLNTCFIHRLVLACNIYVHPLEQKHDKTDSCDVFCALTSSSNSPTFVERFAILLTSSPTFLNVLAVCCQQPFHLNA